MLPVYISGRQLRLSELFSLAPFAITSDWYGAPLPQPVLIYLAVDPAAIHFGAQVMSAPSCDMALAPGSFVEGLWEEDVIELFIKDDGSARYQEFNLAPSGAWWTAVFSEYRIRVHTEDFATPAAIFSKHDGSRWKVGFSCLREALAVQACFTEQSKAAVYAITGKHERRYCALVPGSGKPDFHLSSSFLNLLPVACA
ncbi:MAG TPA: hypothetical protein PLP17_08140 [Oligoflexia bacterium]|nr:hypothetical protein [Oligoflexia bacterium]